MYRANSHECLFAFIDFIVKIKRLINCKVIYYIIMDTNIIGQKDHLFCFDEYAKACSD